MLVLNSGGGGYFIGQWGGGKCGGGGGILKTYCCIPDLKLAPGFKFSTIIGCQLI